MTRPLDPAPSSPSSPPRLPFPSAYDSHASPSFLPVPLQCRTSAFLPLMCLVTITLVRRPPSDPSSPSVSSPSESDSPLLDEVTWGYSLFVQPYSPGSLAPISSSLPPDDAALACDTPTVPRPVPPRTPEATHHVAACPCPSTHPEAEEQAPETPIAHPMPSLKRSRSVDEGQEALRCQCHVRPRYSPGASGVVY